MNPEASPLSPGDVALRFRIGYRTRENSAPWRDVVACVSGVEAVQVVKVDGVFVTWTNGRKSRDGSLFAHTCHRREVISLAWLNQLSAAPAENPASSQTALPPSGLESGAAESFTD